MSIVKNKSAKQLIYTAILPVLILFAAALVEAYTGQTSNGMAQAGTKSLVGILQADTYVASGDPEQRRPLIGAIWVGHDTDELRERRSLLQFELGRAMIPSGSTIVSAQLKLYVAATTPNDEILNVTVRRLLTTFNESVNWNEHVSLNVGSAMAISSLTSELQPVEWDVKALVSEWIADSQAGDSIAFRLQGDKTSGAHRRGFWSRECPSSDCTDSQKPQLVITYTEPTPTPTPTPTPGVEVALSYAPVNSGTTTLPSGPITFTVSYKAGVVEVNDVEVSAIITGNVDFESNGGGQRDGQKITWNIGKMEANQSDSQSFVVISKPSADLHEGTILVGTETDGTVSLIAELDDDNPIATCYQWNFGDGSSVEQGLNIPVTSHTYNKPGTYTVTLRASQDGGHLTTTSAEVPIVNSGRSHVTAIADSGGAIPCTLSGAQTSIVARAFATWGEDGTGRSISNPILINPDFNINLPLIKQKAQ